MLYALLRRWSVPPLVATLACLPALFDAMQLSLEHSVLSDVLFDLLVVADPHPMTWAALARHYAGGNEIDTHGAIPVLVKAR